MSPYQTAWFNTSRLQHYGREAQMMENTLHTSFRLMYELPVNTHRYFVEAVSEETHVRTLLCKRFLGFIEQINKSQKSLPKQLLESIRLDTRSTTGKNIRKILLKVNKNCLSQVNKHDPILGSYCDVNDGDTWKVDMVREITDLRFGSLEVENFSFEQLEEIQNYLCTS